MLRLRCLSCYFVLQNKGKLVLSVYRTQGQILFLNFCNQGSSKYVIENIFFTYRNCTLLLNMIEDYYIAIK